MASLELTTEHLLLRPWAVGDEDAIVHHANNRNVWKGLKDRFPHPYTRGDAEAWIAVTGEEDPPCNFAIVFEGEPTGGIGLVPREDVYRMTAAVGYWLGESVWGRGFATEALERIVEYAWENFDFVRLEAPVFSTNRASARVLQKTGFALEAIARRSVIKDGEILDCHMFVKLRGDA